MSSTLVQASRQTRLLWRNGSYDQMIMYSMIMYSPCDGSITSRGISASKIIIPNSFFIRQEHKVDFSQLYVTARKKIVTHSIARANALDFF